MAKARRDSIHDGRDMPVFVLDDALIDRYGAQVGAYGVAVYTTLARFAKQGHATILAYQTIAHTLGIGKTTVRDTIKRLADAGLIQVEAQVDDAGNPIASNRYVLLPIGDKKAEQGVGWGAATRQGVPPHDTPLPPDDGGVPPHDTGGAATRQGLSPHVYMVDSLSNKNHDPPPPTTMGGGGDFSKPQEEPTGTERYLLSIGFSDHAAYEFRALDEAACRADVKKAQASGQQNGGIIKRWRRSPPRPTLPPAASPPPAWKRDDARSSAETIAALAAQLPGRRTKESPS